MAKRAKSITNPIQAKEFLAELKKLVLDFGISESFWILLMFYGAGDQFRQFIDKFILFKNHECEPTTAYVLFICTAIFGTYYNARLRKHNKEFKVKIIKLESDNDSLKDALKYNNKTKNKLL